MFEGEVNFETAIPQAHEADIIPNQQMFSVVDDFKTAVWQAHEEEEKWIKRNYNRFDGFHNSPIPPTIFDRYHKHVFIGLTYFQVQKQHDDELFLKQLDKGRINEGRMIPNPYSYWRPIIPDQLVFLLLISADNPLKYMKKLSDEAKDTRFFDSAIRAALTLTYQLYTMEDLIRFGREHLHIHQLNMLWKMFAIRGEKGCAIDEVFKSIVHNKINEVEYSLVMETDLYDMCTHYDTLLEWCNPENFRLPYKTFVPARERTPMHDEIEKVVSGMVDPRMELPGHMVEVDACSSTFFFVPLTQVEVDAYTRLLINLVRKNTMQVKELRDKHMEMIDDIGLEVLYTRLRPSRDESLLENITMSLMNLLDDLTYSRRDYITTQVVSATLALSLVVDKSLVIATEVFEIIEIAELRRIALGSRFINRNHLIWAFYECGFGLPPEIRVNLDLPIGEDHPPYVIYLASKELATTFGFEIGCDGRKKLHLEHFVFSILYAKNIIVQKNQVKEMEEHFKTFIEVVALDGIRRPRSARWKYKEA